MRTAAVDQPSDASIPISKEKVAPKPPMRRRIQIAAALFYQRVFVELILRRRNAAASNGRSIPLALQHSEPLVDARYGTPYLSNTIRTSRYTVLDFVPKQLIFQFSRVGNFYFLCVGIPQTVRSTQNSIFPPPTNTENRSLVYRQPALSPRFFPY